MAQQLNITVGTDVILNVTIEHEETVLNPGLIEDLEANLVTGLGKKTRLETSITADYIVVYIPWVDGRLPGCYSLELKGTINGLAWSSIGKSIIRYTNATEAGRETVTVSGDTYDVTMEVGYYYTDSPIASVTASIDNEVGTPSVDVSYARKVLDFKFKKLKGNGIASIEQTTESMEDGGLNVVTITDDLGNESQVGIRNGHGIVGPQGIPGESAVFDPETGNISQMQQTTGDSIVNPMSQKAITDELNGIKNKVRQGVGDFEITDELGFPVVRFDGGHIKTKNFDSSVKIIPSEPASKEEVALDIADNNGYVAFRLLQSGHIITKKFDSRNVVQTDNASLWSGKKLSILGDSISTFGTPDQNNADGIWTYPGNRCRYPQSGWNVTMNDMYWIKLLNRLDMTLGINESWAGSRISNTQATDSGDLGPNRCMASLTRIGHLGGNGTPDLIIVYGGTNDAGNGVTVGTFNTENPTNYTEEQIAALPVATFADAYRTMLIRLQYYYPKARIICFFPNYAPSYYSITNLDKYGEIIREACDFFGVDYLDLRTCGVNIYNKASYLVDGIHPNAAGQNLIFRKLYNFLMFN